MTRESKVGLIVACSFLVLVGIVVASKLKNEEEPGKSASNTPGKEKEKAGPKENEPPKKPEPPPVHAATPDKNHHDVPMPSHAIQAQGTDATLAELEKAKLRNAAGANQGHGNEFPPPGPLATNVKDPVAPAIPPALPSTLVMNDPMKDVVVPAAAPTMPTQGEATPTFPLLPAPAPMQDHVPTSPLENKKDMPMHPAFGDGGKKAVLQFPPEKKDDLPGGLSEPKKGKDDQTFPALPSLKKDEPMVPPIVANPNNGLPTFPAVKNENAAPPPNTFPPLPENKKDTTPSIAPLTNREQPISPGNANDVPTIKAPPALPAPIVGQNDLAKPGLGTTAPLPDFQPKAPPTIPANPFGNSAAPTIGASGARPAPVPVEHIMNATQSGPGEASFAQLSTRLYGTPKYADALYAYNRAHGGNANLSPTIAPNQALVYPTQAGYLESEYATLVRDAAPTIPAAAQNVPAVKLVPPAPQAVPVSAAMPNPAAGQGRSYVVQSASGERIRDIAQRTLGNADRWFDIYRINQSLNLQPQFPLPAGTRLQLPAN